MADGPSVRAARCDLLCHCFPVRAAKVFFFRVSSAPFALSWMPIGRIAFAMRAARMYCECTKLILLLIIVVGWWVNDKRKMSMRTSAIIQIYLRDSICICHARNSQFIVQSRPHSPKRLHPRRSHSLFRTHIRYTHIVRQTHQLFLGRWQADAHHRIRNEHTVHAHNMGNGIAPLMISSLCLSAKHLLVAPLSIVSTTALLSVMPSSSSLPLPSSHTWSHSSIRRTVQCQRVLQPTKNH